MERRKTIQKELVLNAVNDLKSHITADEIYSYIHESYPNIGKGTIYRNLAILVDEGLVNKIEVPDGPDCFDFNLQKHYHIKCIKCKKVYDVDMDEIHDIYKLINNNHGMQILSYDLFFKGICSNCQKEGE